MNEVALKYIRLFRLDINRDDFLRILISSPFYPTLLSLYNTFIAFGFDCHIVKTDLEHLSGLGKYVLIHANINNHWDILLMNKDNRGRYKVYNPSKGRLQPITEEELTNVWDGVVLYTDLKPNSLLKLYQSLVQHKHPILITLALMISVSMQQILDIPLLGLSIIGLILSSSMINTNTLISTPICKRGSLIDCQSVAQSRHSRFLGLPLSVYASAYFSAFSFFTLIGLIALPEPALVHTTLAQVNVLISPIVLLYSLISQIQVRKLCFYCLFILLVLIIMTVLLLPILTMTFKTVPFLFVFGCLYFVFLYLWYREERYIQTNHKYKKTQIENARIKRSDKYLKIRLHKQFDKDDFDYCIQLNYNNEQKIRIGLWVSSTCNHCLKAIQDLKMLLKNNPNNFSLCLFPVDIKKSDRRYGELLEAISSIWTIASKREIPTIEIENIISMINKNHAQRLLGKYNINAFPVLQIEEYFLPNEYGVEDLKCLIIDWSNYS